MIFLVVRGKMEVHHKLMWEIAAKELSKQAVLAVASFFMTSRRVRPNKGAVPCKIHQRFILCHLRTSHAADASLTIFPVTHHSCAIYITSAF
ncbi:hypothetical protein AVEN_171840-1 [Araneus ventricosus]|uniref:Uncharacterized protein n=1 Tax=Araneus ventricosus TaxID=182803 RepID=A0A4Y2F6B9_ARAVE|nr:hypothetical protein AVEN_171840-1 [Araneus ventricosus]